MGLSNLRAAPLSQSGLAHGPWATSDAYLGFLQTPEPSTTLRALLLEQPPGTATMTVLYADEPPGVFAYYLLSYLGWPRQIGLAQCRQQGQASITVRPTQPISGLILLGRAAAPGVIRIGPRLTYQPLSPMDRATSEDAVWTAYCSR